MNINSILKKLYVSLLVLILNQVEYLKGWGSIPKAGEVSIKAADGSTSTVSTKNIIIATGSEVTPLKGVERDGKQ